jgi:3-deoxy-manno-octulosonate cytidylyltransferase (CMP-KDO synthetase)
VPESATPPSEAIAVIPARYGSTRLPAKALADIGGKAMVVRVLERASRARQIQRAVVATDDERIVRAVAPVGEVVMTSALHASGSDRVAEVARAAAAAIVVNVQGDLPLLDPSWIDLLVERLRADPSIGIATPAVPVQSHEELADPNAVKVVVDAGSRALYFSRAPIPCHRDDPESLGSALHHVGIYAYRREVLLRFADLAPTPLEQAEKLEQLRALENGIGIGIVVVGGRPPLEVDTIADLERARAAVLEESAAGSSPAG